MAKHRGEPAELGQKGQSSDVSDGKSSQVQLSQGGSVRQSDKNGQMDARRVPLGAQQACRMVGRLEAAAMIGRVTEAIETDALKQIRDERLFTQWGYESFREFCEKQLPMSHSVCQERIKHLETFGAAFCQWADRNRLSVRVMRCLRQLPAGELQSFVGRVERGEAGDEELVAMAYDYQRTQQELREADEKIAEKRKRVEYLEGKAKTAGETLAERDEQIKNLRAELRIAKHPKDLDAEAKAKAVADAGRRVNELLNAVAGCQLDPKADLQLLADLAGTCTKGATALEKYAQLFSLETTGE